MYVSIINKLPKRRMHVFPNTSKNNIQYKHFVEMIAGYHYLINEFSMHVFAKYTCVFYTSFNLHVHLSYALPGGFYLFLSFCFVIIC